ncbi:unnamed protein product [Alternaria burnsii]|nr:unnamed protein product [Alternaria burnsii]
MSLFHLPLKGEVSLVYLLVLGFITSTGAQSLDAIPSSSTSSTTDLSFLTGTASQVDGQLSAFITITRSSQTTASAPTSRPTEGQPGSGSDVSSGFPTGYTIGTAVGGAVGGLLIISILTFWFRAHKKKKQRLSIGIGSASSNKSVENEKSKDGENLSKKVSQEGKLEGSAVGTGTHMKKLDAVRVLKSTNTM